MPDLPVAATADSPHAAGERTVRWFVLAGSVGLLLLLIAVVTGITTDVLPSPVASKVSYNSEGYLFALVMTPWLYLTARYNGKSWVLPVSLLLGVVWLIVGWWLLNSTLPSSIKTLNEPAIAIGLLLPYVSIRRPLPRRVAPTLLLGVFAVIVAGILQARPAPGHSMDSDNWVIYLGEALGLILLSILALDIVETWILDRRALPKPVTVRIAFYLFLIATPIAVSALGTEARVGNDYLSMTLNYLARVHESFIGVVAMCLILALANALRAERRRLVRERNVCIRGEM